MISVLFGEELENLELRFDIFQQNIASHPVVQVESILWLYHAELQIDDQRILSLKLKHSDRPSGHSPTKK